MLKLKQTIQVSMKTKKLKQKLLLFLIFSSVDEKSS